MKNFQIADETSGLMKSRPLRITNWARLGIYLGCTLIVFIFLLALISAAANKHDTFSCGMVTCCLDFHRNILAIFVNEFDITSSLMPQSQLNNPSISKIFTFAEPSGQAIIAVCGGQKKELTPPQIVMRCFSTRNASAWNFVTDLDGSWKSVPPFISEANSNSLPIGWNSLNYNGNTEDLFAVQTLPIDLDTFTCGNPDEARVLEIKQGDFFPGIYGVRKLVQNEVCIS